MYLIVIDSFSKWLEVFQTRGCTTKITVSKLRQLFWAHGLPDVIVSDKGISFTSDEFKEFMGRNGIPHIITAPYHPSTNGLAENAVKTFKQAMKKCCGNSEERLQRFLFDYRIMPHVTELLMKRRLKSIFDLMRPDIEGKVFRKQEGHAKYYKGSNCKTSNYDDGDHVYFTNYSRTGTPNIIRHCQEIIGARMVTSNLISLITKRKKRS